MKRFLIAACLLLIAADAGMPATEASFIAAANDALAKWNGAANDMQKGGILAGRTAAQCRVLAPTHNTASGWTGTVDTLDTADGGKGVLVVKIADNITLQTTNNAFGEAIDHTLIPVGSPLFATAAAMRIGQAVQFDAAFVPGSGGACLEEMSLTNSGSVEQPEYEVRFTALRPLGN
ncbi:MAG: hypothetical protein KGN77_02020 [Xanthomonadaceae bacterium]|nr:hypothetical protein [Xanthomonadaceae bacterium]